MSIDILGCRRDQDHEKILADGKQRLETMHSRLSGFLNNSQDVEDIKFKERENIQRRSGNGLARENAGSAYYHKIQTEKLGGGFSDAGFMESQNQMRKSGSYTSSTNYPRNINLVHNSSISRTEWHNSAITPRYSSGSGQPFKAQTQIPTNKDLQKKTLEILEGKIKGLKSENNEFIGHPPVLYALPPRTSVNQGKNRGGFIQPGYAMRSKSNQNGIVGSQMPSTRESGLSIQRDHNNLNFYIDSSGGRLNRLKEEYEERRREWIQRTERPQGTMLISENPQQVANPYEIKELKKLQELERMREESTLGNENKGYKILDSSRDIQIPIEHKSGFSTLRPNNSGYRKIKSPNRSSSKQLVSTVRKSSINSSMLKLKSSCKSSATKRKPSIQKDSNWSIAIQKQKPSLPSSEVSSNNKKVAKKSSHKKRSDLPPKPVHTLKNDPPEQLLEVLADLIAEKLASNLKKRK